MSGPAKEPEAPLPADWEPTEADFADEPDLPAPADVEPPEPAPIAPAAPLAVGATIGRVLSIWASTLPWLLPLVALARAPLTLLSALHYDQTIRWSEDPASTAPPDAATEWALSYFDYFVGSITVAAAYRVVAARLEGARPRIGSALRLAAGRLSVVAGIATVITLVHAVANILGRAFVAVGFDPIGAAIVTGIGLILVLLGWHVAVPAACDEPIGTFAALRASLRLTRGQRWRILLLVMLGGGVHYGVHFLVDRQIHHFTGHDWLWFASRESASLLVAALLAVVPTVVHVHLRSGRDAVAPQRLATIFQ